jgi:predicted transposase/invertase (TIGR01784 family)
VEDWWLYTLKNAEKLPEFPKTIPDEVIRNLYKKLQTNKLTPEEMEAYSSSVLEMNKYALFTDHAKMEGRIEGEIAGEIKGKIAGRIEGKIEGRMESKIELVLNAISKGFSIKDIAEITNLSPEQIREILSER